MVILTNAFDNLLSHIEKVDKISSAGSIVELDKANNMYDWYEKILNNTSYLQDITDEVIYQAYQSEI